MKISDGTHTLINITKKLTRHVYFFGKILNILNTNYIKIVYYTLCQSRIEYGITGWGSALGTYTERLNIAHKGIIKTILKVPIRTPSDEIFKNFQVFNIQGLYSKMYCLD